MTDGKRKIGTLRMLGALAGVLLLAAGAAAQPPDPLLGAPDPAAAPAAPAARRIGFVDIEDITRRSVYVQSTLRSIEGQIQAKQEALDRRKGELADLQAEIDRKKSVLSETELDKLVRKARELRLDIDDADFELQKQYGKAERDHMGPALEKVLQAVEKVGSSEGYELILRGEVVLYGHKQVNLTDRVIRLLDQDAPSTASQASPGGDPAAVATPSVRSPRKATPTPKAASSRSSSVRSRGSEPASPPARKPGVSAE